MSPRANFSVDFAALTFSQPTTEVPVVSVYDSDQPVYQGNLRADTLLDSTRVMDFNAEGIVNTKDSFASAISGLGTLGIQVRISGPGIDAQTNDMQTLVSNGSVFLNRSAVLSEHHDCLVLSTADSSPVQIEPFTSLVLINFCR